MTAAVDGKKLPLPVVDVELVAPPTLLLPAKEGGPNLAPAPETGPYVTFKARYDWPVAASVWTLTLSRVEKTGDRVVVRALSGAGTPVGASDPLFGRA